MLRVLLFFLNGYQKFVSPLLPHRCRFFPTCSEYGKTAISTHGWKGLWLTMKRIGRCHPWHPGGFDPVPLSIRMEDLDLG